MCKHIICVRKGMQMVFCLLDVGCIDYLPNHSDSACFWELSFYFCVLELLNSLFAHTSRRLTQYLEFLIIINYDQCNQHQAHTNCERLQTAFRNDQMLSRIIHDSQRYAAWLWQNRCPASLREMACSFHCRASWMYFMVGGGQRFILFNAPVNLESGINVVYFLSLICQKDSCLEFFRVPFYYALFFTPWQRDTPYCFLDGISFALCFIVVDSLVMQSWFCFVFKWEIENR